MTGVNFNINMNRSSDLTISSCQPLFEEKANETELKMENEKTINWDQEERKKNEGKNEEKKQKKEGLFINYFIIILIF